MELLNENMLIEAIYECLDRRFVYRNRNGEIVISKRPMRNAPLTELQQKQISRFRDAVVYAKAAIADVEIRKGYAEKAKRSKRPMTAYNVAVADYMNGPVIGEINLKGYKGDIGNVIRIWAADDFRVAGAMVEIFRDDGSLLEVGMAECTGASLNKWVYYAQSAIACVTGYRVNVRVWDLPGNVAEKEVGV